MKRKNHMSTQPYGKRPGVFFLTSLLLIGLAAASCSRETDIPSQARGVDRTVTIQIGAVKTKASGVTDADESTVGSIQAFIYRDGVLYDSGYAASASEISLSCPSDGGTVVVVGNASRIEPSSPGIDALRGTVIPLSENGVGNLVVYGCAETGAVSEGQTLTIDARRLTSKITLESVSNRMFLEEDRTKSVVLRSAYLINVAGDGRLDGAPSAPGTWVNKNESEQQSPLFHESLGSRMLAYGSTAREDITFYAMPNPTVPDSYESSWSPRHTRLIVEADVNGETCYYPYTLPVMEANTDYVIDEIVIKQPGTPVISDGWDLLRCVPPSVTCYLDEVSKEVVVWRMRPGGEIETMPLSSVSLTEWYGPDDTPMSSPLPFTASGDGFRINPAAYPGTLTEGYYSVVVSPKNGSAEPAILSLRLVDRSTHDRLSLVNRAPQVYMLQHSTNMLMFHYDTNLDTDGTYVRAPFSADEVTWEDLPTGVSINFYNSDGITYRYVVSVGKNAPTGSRGVRMRYRSLTYIVYINIVANPASLVFKPGSVRTAAGSSAIQTRLYFTRPFKDATEEELTADNASWLQDATRSEHGSPEVFSPLFSAPDFPASFASLQGGTFCVRPTQALTAGSSYSYTVSAYKAEKTYTNSEGYSLYNYFDASATVTLVCAVDETIALSRTVVVLNENKSRHIRITYTNDAGDVETGGFESKWHLTLKVDYMRSGASSVYEFDGMLDGMDSPITLPGASAQTVFELYWEYDPSTDTFLLRRGPLMSTEPADIRYTLTASTLDGSKVATARIYTSSVGGVSDDDGEGGDQGGNF